MWKAGEHVVDVMLKETEGVRDSTAAEWRQIGRV
jgi:hypothetical protein